MVLRHKKKRHSSVSESDNTIAPFRPKAFQSYLTPHLQVGNCPEGGNDPGAISLLVRDKTTPRPYWLPLHAKPPSRVVATN